MELRVVQTTPKLILEWDPVPGAVAGYRGRAGGVEKWTQTQQTRMTFAANATGIVIQALGVEDEGKYPPSPPPPLTDSRSLSYLRWAWLGLPPTHMPDYKILMIDEPGQYGSRPETVIRYFDGMGANTNTDRRSPVTEEQARANGWILHNPDGTEMFNTRWGVWYCDQGDPAFGQAFADEMIRRLDAEGLDGAFVDNCARGNMRRSREYPDAEAAGAGTIAFMRKLAVDMHAAGKYLLCNASGYTSGDGRSNTKEINYVYWSQLVAGKQRHEYPDCVMEEYCFWNANGMGIAKRGTDAWYKLWDQKRHWMKQCRTLPIEITELGDGDADARKYCYASWLLDWEPGTGYETVNGGAAADTWMPNPGLPTGPPRTNGSREERPYERGLVWVDPVAGTASLP